VDEYGGISGLATMEDLIEEIVGDIHDTESAEEQIVEETPGSYIVPGASISTHCSLCSVLLSLKTPSARLYQALS
jgi:CBS domain containing-hemolysin-like protein